MCGCSSSVSGCNGDCSCDDNKYFTSEINYDGALIPCIDVLGEVKPPYTGLNKVLELINQKVCELNSFQQNALLPSIELHLEYKAQNVTNTLTVITGTSHTIAAEKDGDYEIELSAELFTENSAVDLDVQLFVYINGAEYTGGGAPGTKSRYIHTLTATTDESHSVHYALGNIALVETDVIDIRMVTANADAEVRTLKNITYQLRRLS